MLLIELGQNTSMESWLGRAKPFWTTTFSQNQDKQQTLTETCTDFTASECVKHILNRQPVLYLANISLFHNFHALWW